MRRKRKTFAGRLKDKDVPTERAARINAGRTQSCSVCGRKHKPLVTQRAGRVAERLRLGLDTDFSEPMLRG